MTDKELEIVVKTLQKWISLGLGPTEGDTSVAQAKFIVGDDGFVRCSACGKTIRYPLSSFSDIEYCPRCGVKISGQEEI